MVIVSLFAVLTVVGGKINVPLPVSPVPMTLQTAVVLASGMLLGSRRGALAMTLYMTLGLIGLPVFAYGGGLQSLLSPSFGFIVGFIFSAWTAGKICELADVAHEKSPRTEARRLGIYITSCIAGMIVYDIIGATWLYFNVKYIMGHAIGLYGALTMGVLPYLLPDILKAAAVVVVAMIVSRRISA
jgi:biotin transport system substrate-specific component